LEEPLPPQTGVYGVVFPIDEYYSFGKVSNMNIFRRDFVTFSSLFSIYKEGILKCKAEPPKLQITYLIGCLLPTNALNVNFI
jgi:hypothetical protein